VRGTVVGDESEWWIICDERNKMIRKGDYEYELIVPLKEGTYSFKIADYTWKAVNLGLMHSEDDLLQLQNGRTLNYADNDRDVRIHIETTGRYRFFLQAANRKEPTLTIEPTFE
jgi:hypothetical protein